MVHIINILLGFLFLFSLFGNENFLLCIIISLSVYLLINPGKHNFLKLIFSLIINIPKTIFETFLVFFLKKEYIISLSYTDKFNMLEKILTITLTPKTLVFDDDEYFLYIHKIDR